MDLNIFQSHSLKARVTLFSLTIFVLSIWALALFASRMLRADMQQQLGDQQLASVTGVAAGISHKLEERLVALDQVAERMDPALLRHDAALQEFLEAQPVFRGLFNAGVIVTTLDGTVSHAVPFAKERIGVNTLAVGAIAAALQQGRTTVGQPVMNKAMPAPLITMAAPIRNPQGQVIGALAGMINLTLPNLLDPISQGRYGKTGSYLLVARPARMVITNTDKKRVMEAAPAPGVNRLIDRFMQGYEGSAIFVDPFDVETLTSAKGIALADWYVAAALPTAEAFAPIDAMQRRILLATVLLTLLAGGLTWWMLRRQLAPLLATAQTLVALPTAQTFPIALPVTHPDEIGHLIDGFNHLLAHLHQRETLLKQILDTSSAAIFVIDSQGRITQANQRMAEMFGCPLDTLIGHDYVSLVHPAERNVGQQNMLALLSNIFTFKLQRPGKEEGIEKNLIRILNRAGFKTWWISNQGQGEWFDSWGTMLSKLADTAIFVHKRNRRVKKLDGLLVEPLVEALADPFPEGHFCAYDGGSYEYSRSFSSIVSNVC